MFRTGRIDGTQTLSLKVPLFLLVDGELTINCLPNNRGTLVKFLHFSTRCSEHSRQFLAVFEPPLPRLFPTIFLRDFVTVASFQQLGSRKFWSQLDGSGISGAICCYQLTALFILTLYVYSVLLSSKVYMQ